MEGVYRIEAFNVWADSQAEADEMRQALIDFVGDLGRRGIKVKAGKVTEAVRSWDRNPLVRNRIVEHFKK